MGRAICSCMRSLACAAYVVIFAFLVLASALVKAAADLLDLGSHTGLLQRGGWDIHGHVAGSGY